MFRCTLLISGMSFLKASAPLSSSSKQLKMVCEIHHINTVRSGIQSPAGRGFKTTNCFTMFKISDLYQFNFTLMANRLLTKRSSRVLSITVSSSLQRRWSDQNPRIRGWCLKSAFKHTRPMDKPRAFRHSDQNKNDVLRLAVQRRSCYPKVYQVLTSCVRWFD